MKSGHLTESAPASNDCDDIIYVKTKKRASTTKFWNSQNHRTGAAVIVAKK
jgi:hypothetical protein